MCCKFLHTIVHNEERKKAAAVEVKRVKSKVIRKPQKQNWMGQFGDMTVDGLLRPERLASDVIFRNHVQASGGGSSSIRPKSVVTSNAKHNSRGS